MNKIDFLVFHPSITTHWPMLHIIIIYRMHTTNLVVDLRMMPPLLIVTTVLISVISSQTKGSKLEEDDILFIELLCDLVGWWHAMTVGHPMIYLDMSLGVWTKALRLHVGLKLEGSSAL